jgi:Heavy metal associated domain 2
MIQHGATVVHHIPGRLRVRLPRASRRPDILHDLHGFISGLGGVRRVEINPVTGSILVHYAPESAQDVEGLLAGGASSGWEAPPELTDVDEMADRIEKEAEFLSAHSEVALHLVKGVKVLNTAVR